MIETHTLLRKASDVWLVEHPADNMGVLCTASKTSASVLPGEARVEDQDRDHESQTSALSAPRGALLLDFLRVRLPDTRETWEALKSWLGPMAARPFGWRGWYDQSAAVLDKGIVAWCRDSTRAEVQGILVDLSGRACASMGDRLVPFLEWALENGGNATRLDFALDDHDGLLTLDRIVAAEGEGRIISRWRGLTMWQKRYMGKIEGWTCYWGRRQSEAYLRIYDKAGEQGVPGPWVRLELECKGKFADALGREYFRRGSQAVIEQVNRRIRFVDHSETDTNMRRAPACDWWVKLLGSVKPGQSLLTGEVPQCTVASMGQWLEVQAGPTLATLRQADGGSLERILALIGRSERRMQPKHHAALAALGRIPSPGVRVGA